MFDPVYDEARMDRFYDEPERDYDPPSPEEYAADVNAELSPDVAALIDGWHVSEASADFDPETDPF